MILRWLCGHLPPLLRRGFAMRAVLVGLGFGMIAHEFAWISWMTIRPLRLPPGRPWLSWELWMVLRSAIWLPAVVALLWYVLGTRRRLRARLQEHDHCLCGTCGQSLRGLPSPGRCPECGRAFRLKHVRSFWRRFDPGTREAAPPRPPFAPRRGLSGHALSVLGWCIIIALVPFRSWQRSLEDYLISLWTLAFIGVPVLFVWVYVCRVWTRRRVARRVISMRYLVCPDCGRDLRQDVAAGRCECCKGPLDPDEVQRRWAAHLPPHWEIEFGHEQD